MDLWTADMTEFAQRLVLALLATLLTAWKVGLLNLAHEWAAGLKDERMAAVADKIVLAAEQQFGGGAGEQKLAWVLDQPAVAKLGLDRADIEAAVAIMNAAKSDAATATPATTDAAALESIVRAIIAKSTAGGGAQ